MIRGVKIGFCGYWTREMKTDQVKKTIRSLREECDIVVASFHWGTEYKYTPNKAETNLARQAIDAGADLVLGHHPHVVGALEQYKGKYIIYSLGNCCFGGNFGRDESDSVLFQQKFILEGGEIRDGGVTLIPYRYYTAAVRKNNYRPGLLTGKDAERVLGKIDKASRTLQYGVNIKNLTSGAPDR